MKKTVCCFLPLLLLLSQFAFCAEDPLQRAASVKYEKTPLADVLKDLQGKTGVRVAFAKELAAAAQPVTYAAEKTPVAKVLRDVLWPRGLELIRSDAELLALVPAASELGAAKQFGSALRTFVRLEAKLEKAEAKGDQVVVPEWTAEDELALTRAGLDFFASIIFIVEQRGAARDWEDVQRCADSPDPDVRAGSVLVMEATRSLGITEFAPARVYLQKMAGDNDEIVAAVGLVFMGECLRGEVAEPARKFAADPRPVMRAAAQIAGLFSGVAVPAQANEPSAAVRFLSSLNETEQLRRPYSAAFEKLAAKLEREPNPIVQGMLLAMLGIMKADSRTETLAPRGFAARFPKGSAWQKMLAAKLDEGITTDIASVKSAVSLLLSERQSDQAAGLSLALGKLAFHKFPQPKDAAGMNELMQLLQPLLALQKSPRPALRAAGVALHGLLPEAPPQPFVDALKSDDVMLRLPALAVLAGTRPKAPIDLAAAGREALRSPHYLEALVGAEILYRPNFDELMKTFLAEIQKDPHSAIVKASASKVFNKANEPQLQQLADAIVASRSEELIGVLVRHSHRYRDFDKALYPRLLETLEPRMLLPVMQMRIHMLPGDRESLRILVPRLESIIDGKDAALRSRTVQVCAQLASRMWFPVIKMDGTEDRELRDKTMSLMQKVLAHALKSQGRDAEAAMQIVGGLFSQSTGGLLGKEIPAWVVEAFDVSLARVNEPELSEKAATIVANVLDGLKQKRFAHAGLQQKANAAKARILAEGPAAAAVQLLQMGALKADPESIELLSRMCLDGKVPAKQITHAVGAIPVDLAPKAYVDWLLKLVAEGTESKELRHYAFEKLSSSAEIPALLATLRTMLQERKERLRGYSFYTLSYWLRDQRQKLTPETLAAARDFAKLLLSETDADFQQQGAGIYGAALSGDGLAKVADEILAEKLPLPARVAILSNLPADKALAPAFRQFAASYDKLPKEILDALGPVCARVPDEDASKLLAKWLKDERIQKQTRSAAMFHLNTVRSDELVAALTALRGEPEFQHLADRAIRNWQAATPSEPPAKPPAPPAGDF